MLILSSLRELLGKEPARLKSFVCGYILFLQEKMPNTQLLLRVFPPVNFNQQIN